jgi:drug/metabolite transporter (DMT)-like permease
MGDMLVLVSIFCGVISIIITKSVALKIKTEQLTFMNLVPGTIPLIAYTVLVPQDWNIAAMPAKAWSALIFTIICVVGANLLFFYGLKQKPAHKTGIYTYIQVAVAILMAWLLLGEHPVPLFIVGVILIGSGVYIAQLHKTSQNRHRVSTEVHKEGEHNYTK